MSNVDQLHALLAACDANTLHQADARFGQLLQRYYEATRAMRASEAGSAAHDDFTLFRLHRQYDDAAAALVAFFTELNIGKG